MFVRWVKRRNSAFTSCASCVRRREHEPSRTQTREGGVTTGPVTSGSSASTSSSVRVESAPKDSPKLPPKLPRSLARRLRNGDTELVPKSQRSTSADGRHRKYAITKSATPRYIKRRIGRVRRPPRGAIAAREGAGVGALLGGEGCAQNLSSNCTGSASSRPRK